MAVKSASVASTCASVHLLALLSLVAFLGVAAIAGALHLSSTVRSALGIAQKRDAYPFSGAFGDAHPLDYVEARDS